jgi:hypothetical protein
LLEAAPDGDTASRPQDTLRYASHRPEERRTCGNDRRTMSRIRFYEMGKTCGLEEHKTYDLEEHKIYDNDK